MDYQSADTNIVPLYSECVEHASSSYGIHPDVMYAILIVEGGTVGKVSGNKNGSFDIGPAQINSTNLEELNNVGVSKDQLLNNGCLNVYVAARHLAKSITGSGPIKNEEDYLSAIARYHSGTPEHNRTYAQKLKNAFKLLYSGGAPK